MGYGLSLACIPFVLIFSLIMQVERESFDFIFKSKFAAFLGKNSFMWYLIHQNIGYIIMNGLIQFDLVKTIFVPYVAMLITFMMAVMLEKFFVNCKLILFARGFTKLNG